MVDRDTYMYVKADFPAIVTEEEWRAVEKIHHSRTFHIPEKDRYDPVLGKIEHKHPMVKNNAKWTKKLRCACGACMRRNKWHANKKIAPSYGFVCYSQVNNGSAQKRIKLGLDPTGFCNMPQTAEWKLDFVANTILRDIFSNSLQRKVILEAMNVLEKCYEDQDRQAINNGAAQREIGRIQAKINNLVDLYTDGEISKEDYRVKRDRLNSELTKAKEKLVTVVEEKKNMRPDKNEFLEIVRKQLRKRVSLEENIPAKEIIDTFIGRVIIQKDRNYTVYINMSGVDDDRMTEHIRETEPVLKYEREFTFEEAKAWRRENGEMLRKSQWVDITVEVIII